jgi:hypothetical protein
MKGKRLMHLAKSMDVILAAKRHRPGPMFLTIALRVVFTKEMGSNPQEHICHLPDNT